MGDDFTSDRIGPVPTAIVVRYATGETRSFPDRNWQIERIGPDREPFLAIGHGIPCTYIPLANVLSFDLVQGGGDG